MNGKKIIMLCQYFYPEYISSAELPYQTAFESQPKWNGC